VGQRKHKRDEESQQKHQKQATLIRKQKKNHFYVAKNVTNTETTISRTMEQTNQ